MEYFSKPFNISLLKNHILKDPVIDWFIINSKINNSYKKDKNTHYKDFILKEWNIYKTNFLNTLKEKAKKKIPINTSVQETQYMINKKEDLILGGHLIYNDMIIYCDIIIDIKLFNSIFPKIKNYPMHSIKNKYILINLSYSTINFKNDLKECLNDGVLLYKKCVLHGFSKSIEQLEGYTPKLFIIGKEYYYKKTHLSNDEFISHVGIDNNIIDKFNTAYNWICFLRKNFISLEIKEKPSHKELYPNMNNKDSEWENEKLKLANKIKEITLIWNITYDKRCELHQKNIFCWDDPKLLQELKESNKKFIQEQMIHMNKNDDILLHPRKNVSTPLKEILQEKETNNIFFDVESFLTIDEKVDFFNKKEEKYDNPILAIIGFFYKGKFYDYTIQSFNTKQEEIIIKNYANKLWEIYKNFGRINIFHWGHAEYKYMDYIHEKYPNIDFPEYILVDLLDHFRLEPIIVQGVFQFGLKSIGKALYQNKLIETTWNDDIDNGLDAMIKFKEICKKNENKNIPIKRYIEIKEIINYNRIDCKVLQDIYFLLKNKYK